MKYNCIKDLLFKERFLCYLFNNIGILCGVIIFHLFLFFISNTYIFFLTLFLHLYVEIYSYYKKSKFFLHQIEVNNDLSIELTIQEKDNIYTNLRLEHNDYKFEVEKRFIGFMSVNRLVIFKWEKYKKVYFIKQDHFVGWSEEIFNEIEMKIKGKISL